MKKPKTKVAAETVSCDEPQLTRALVEMLEEPLFVKNNDHRFVFVNRAFCDMLGVEVIDVIGKTLEEQLTADEMRHFFEVDRRVLDTGIPDLCEETLTPSPGLTLTILTRKTRFVDDCGNRFLLGVIYDITKRKEAEAALRESEKRFMDVLYASGDAILLIDGDTFVDCNNATTRMLGYADKKQFLMTHPSTLSPTTQPDGRNSLEKADEIIRSAVANGFHRFEWMNHKANGEEFLVEVSLTPITMQGRMLLYCVWRDITEQKKAAAAFAESEARYRAIFEANKDGMLVADAQNQTFKYANPEICRMFGYSEREFTELGLDDIHPKESLAAVTASFQAQARGELQLAPSQPCLRKDGTVFLADINTTLVTMDGRTCLVGMFRDVTERDQLQRSQINIQKLESLGTLAGGIAHDFNNFLTSIMCNLSVLQAQADGRNTELFDDIQQACMTAAALSKQLLTFAKGGLPITKDQRLRPIIRQVAEFATRGSNVRCVFDLGPDPFIVNVDMDMTSQVIHNLVLNAIQAMPAGGDISFKAVAIVVGHDEVPPLTAGRYVQVTLTDCGVGIKPESLASIFDPYFSTKGAGRGLGLSMCHSIMAKQGGLITAESKPGEGAVFTLYFPMVDVAVNIPLPPNKPALKTGGGRVLIMDDEALICASLKCVLKQAGYHAESVANGQEALDAYAQAMKAGKAYDVVIMDLTIAGGMGGKEAVGKLLAIDPKAKVIVSSGYSDDPVVTEFRKHGFCGLLPKPYMDDAVCDAVRHAINATTH